MAARLIRVAAGLRAINRASYPPHSHRSADFVLRRFSASAPEPVENGENTPISPKVEKLLEQIVLLNMLEVKQLATGLKERLGISDTAPLMGMPMGMPMMAPGAAAGPAEEEAPPPPEKTHFDIKLEAYDAGKKIPIIKEIRTITSLGLKEAKALVDNAPGIVKEGVSKDDAEQIRATLTELGATIALE